MKRKLRMVIAAALLPLTGHTQIEGDPIPPELDRMYVRGLDFLASTQKDDGSWEDSYGSNAGVVGMAALAMLAHGDDPEFGPYSDSIRKALDFVLKKQDEENGYIGQSMYNHGFATLALAEAYGVVDDKRLGPALKSAVDLILTSQKGNPNGAWRYNPTSTDADSTVSGAQLVALIAARNAGLKVPDAALSKGIAYLKNCQDSSGGIGYSGPGGPNPARTAIGVLVMALAKQQDSRQWRAAASYMASADRQQEYFHYYLYYAAQAYFRLSPQLWEEWNARNMVELLETQGDDGRWEGQFGASFGTASSLLSVALNYRFLPIYER